MTKHHVEEGKIRRKTGLLHEHTDKSVKREQKKEFRMK